GCACPDGGGCDHSVAGFGNQVQCSANTMKGYYASLNAGHPTIAGWNVGHRQSTSDPCWVTPANKATAALYTYTPWVGAYGQGCGDRNVGGSSLVALSFRKYESEQTWGAPEDMSAPPTVDGSTPHLPKTEDGGMVAAPASNGALASPVLTDPDS